MYPSPAPTKDEAILATPPTLLLFILIGIVVVCLTLGLGSTLTIDHVKKTLKTRLPPSIAISCQYGLMPLIAFSLAKIFSFSPAKSIGLLLCGAVPGGETSNLFTYYIGGDVGLSIFMTVASVLTAIAFVPLCILIYAPPLLDSSDDDNVEITVPYLNIFVSLLMVIFPTMAGIYLRTKSELWATRAEKVGSVVGALFILAALISGLLDNLALLNSDWQTWVASAALSICGFICGFTIGIVAKLPKMTAITIGLEVGVQNTILSILMAYITFKDSPPRILNEALIFPLMCSLWDVVNSLLLLLLVKLNVFGDLNSGSGGGSDMVQDGDEGNDYLNEKGSKNALGINDDL
jgi:bile acid transporter